MHAKLHQLVISALKRNHRTANLSLKVSLNGYQVTVAGEVASESLADEILTTVQAVSPMLKVRSQIKVLFPTQVTTN
jgi:hypothetical protein